MLKSSGWRGSATVAAILASFLLSIGPAAALAAPASSTDVFTGSAIIPAGYTSPVQVNPADVTARADGAIGFGYTYQAAGQALGDLPGTFTYVEHGYLYFQNPLDPKSLVGSSFTSGVYTLKPSNGGAAITIADTSPSTYTSGIQTLVGKVQPHVRADLRELLGTKGRLTYGYFTFTDSQGTFTGYATPDFDHFVIQITF
jgi:hypothetical protein